MTFFPFFHFNAFKCERVYMCVCMCVYKVFEKCWQNEDSWGDCKQKIFLR